MSTPSSSRALRNQILCYGLAELGLQMSINAIAQYLMFFYSDVAGLGIAAAGAVKGIGRLWDAVNDPLMGYVSDHTGSRAGRRRFWFPIAAAPLWLGMWLLFSPPESLGGAGLFAWMLVTYFAVDVCFTLFMTPYYALGAELSDDPQLRTRIIAVRTFFAYIGGVLGAGMIGFAPLLGSGRAGWSLVALAFGMLTSIAMAIAYFGTTEKPAAAPSAPPSAAGFVDGMRGSLANPPFRVLIMTFFVMMIGSGLNAASGIYFFVYWIGMKPEEAGLVIPFYVGAASLALPVWTAIARRSGKDVALKALCIYEVFIFASMWFLGPVRWHVYAFLAFAGFGLSGFIVLGSLLADVLDDDELRTGEKRGGAFFGFWTFGLKLSTALGPPVIGFVLGGLGYVANQPQSAEVLLAIRLLYGPIPGVFFLIAAILCWRFPLTRAEHERVQAALAVRRAAAH